YEEGRDDVIDEDEDGLLPEINKGEAAAKSSVTPNQHFTQPPPRYTEATLVKRMEELGIGRPSTYASIIGTIQDREYVRKDKGRLIPEDKGRLVTAFLSNYFQRIVDYDFTAGLEERLDDVSGGRENWKTLLANWWRDFSGDLAETKDLRIGEVLEKINEVLAPHLFPDPGDGSDPRLCKSCGIGRLSMRTARSGGAFIGCSNYPDCRYTRALGGEETGGEDKVLGQDEYGVDVWLKSGRFGPYVQLGEQEPDSKEKPKRASIPKGMAPEAVGLPKALELLSLPRLVGQHPNDGEPIETAIGRYGPYVRHGKIYANLKDPEEVFTLGMNRAVELIEEKRANPGRGRTAAKALKELGEHPAEGGMVAVMEGRYGPYVKWGKINATL
ncbi:MAG: topoisomerase C-terminal repeat-containing protein, partial [Pseudomonadota bacterium]